MTFLIFGQAIAYDINDTTFIDINEYDTYYGGVFGQPTDLGVNGNPGYFLWTDDEGRRNWNIAWQGDGTSTIYGFDGKMYLSSELDGNELTSIAEWSFEGAPYEDEISYSDSDDIEFGGWANTGIDSITFSIVGDAMPSYLAFDLRMHVYDSDGNRNTFAGSGMADYIHIGALGETSGEEDFKIPAPVPEPATILLFGAGLLGLAAYGRKKGIKRS